MRDGGGDVLGGLGPAECRADALGLGSRRVGPRGHAEGDVPLCADIDTLSAYLSSVRYGVSVQARDGATREELFTVVDCVMAGWDRLVRPPT
ncbi:hypothetical protein PA7_27890 [Pseudonocardia asaccharolytica DSM 44247 = NBRC 16224]|uniref:Uncharacterized protein n=1 Tax=Pseudonocardia asaccharolytica DSM 44247 = NBRC 16224 TaxID=1123024 RepID=A0A511D2E7_9PSEU|nr:hypothetical protein PA7_27890 [Pseudonocardia asaccharolytica DSM 44247 = NBRC 16224]